MRTFSLLVASLGALALSALSQTLDFYPDCENDTDPIKIHSISLLPDLQPGHDLIIKVNAEVKEVINEGAYAEILVKLGLIKIRKEDLDICATAQCPIQPGIYEIQHTVALPAEIPHVKFNVNVQGYTAEDEELMCFQLGVDFRK